MLFPKRGAGTGPRGSNSFAGKGDSAAARKKVPELNDFIEKRDWSGALGLLKFQLNTEEAAAAYDSSMVTEKLFWMAYCYMHLGAFQEACEKLDQHLMHDPEPEASVWLWKAVCKYGMGQYKDAEECAFRGPQGQLQNRILFHVAHKLGEETQLINYHHRLTSSIEDQLSLAGMHFLRGHYQEATDLYKRILLEQRDHLALNIYVALCYYKLDYYDVSLEILGLYLAKHPDSVYAINIKACNHYKLYNGAAAETELKALSAATGVPIGNIENDLIRHNVAVFRNGENALQVFPSTMGVIPEARLNLCIYYLNQNQLAQAQDIIKDMTPTQPEEYILRAVVAAAMGQETSNSELIKEAQQNFQIFGASSTHCDTIPGRQCMAQCFFLLKQFEDVNIYLKSIAPYLQGDDKFNYNFGISQAANDNFRGAEASFDAVRSDAIRSEFSYIAWRAKTKIHCGKPQLAWEAYLSLDASSKSYTLLQMIANECYRMGYFFYALKAFDVLERLDPSPEYWEGKRGACVGSFQMILAGKEPRDQLPEIVNMLRNTSNPQVEYILRVIKRWAKENNIHLEDNMSRARRDTSFSPGRD